jgi:serine/threonine-protein kinase
MLPNDHDLPLLIDFGVGKQVINPDQLNLKEDDHSDAGSFVGKMSFVGKIGYAPREQISMGRCSPSCDLYALGVTAVVLLTGKNPTLLLDQYSLEWRWHSYCQVSDSFTQILDQLLADQPQHRYQVAKEVLADLQQLEQPEATIISHPTHPPEAEPEPEPLPAKSETTIISSSSSMRPQEVEIELSSSDSLDSEFVERCQRELAVSIGPIASFIIDDVIAQSFPHSPHELVEALAAEIPDLREAREFKHRVFS